MAVRRRLVLLGSAIALAGAAALGYWAVCGRSPEVDPALARAASGPITRSLEQGHWRGVLQSEHPDRRVEWFCAEQVIETRQDRDGAKVGLLTGCDEFTAVDGALLVGSGERVPRVATVTAPPAPVEVLRIESAPDGAAHSAWVEANFSRAGAAEVHHSTADLGTATIAKARSAFGLPADAPVHKGRP